MSVSPYRARVLIVEDDPELNSQLGVLLPALNQRFDLILLDVLLPRMDGFSVLKQLRRTCQTPVMILSACGAEEERIQGFSGGADDYVAKPFSFTELLLRMEAVLRRSMGWQPPTADACELRLDGLILDRRRQTVHFAGTPVELTPVQFRLLWMLALHAGQPVSKPCLYQLVLERDFSCHDRSLDMHVSRVRRKLTAAGMAAGRLQTLHGKGYSFV